MKTDTQKLLEAAAELNAAEQEIARLKHIIDQALRQDPTSAGGSTNDVYDILVTANKSTIPLIDLDQRDWSDIKRAAMESPWIPEHYFKNDWVSDVCAFLREPAIAQVDNVNGFVAGLMSPPPGDSPSCVEIATTEELQEIYRKVDNENTEKAD